MFGAEGVKVDFRKSFEKDLGRIRDQDLLLQIKAVIESVENAESLLDVGNIKKLRLYRIGYASVAIYTKV
jgi:hypothetical protein